MVAFKQKGIVFMIFRLCNFIGISVAVPCLVHGSETDEVIDTTAQVTVVIEEFHRKLCNPPKI